MKYPKLSAQEIATYIQSRLLGFEPNGDKGAAFCHSQCKKGWPSLFGLEAELSGLDEDAAIAEVGEIIGREFPIPGRTRRGKIVAQYPYQDEAGQLLYEI